MEEEEVGVDQRGERASKRGDTKVWRGCDVMWRGKKTGGEEGR